MMEQVTTPVSMVNHYIGVYVGKGLTLRDEDGKSWASLSGNIIGYCNAIDVDNDASLVYFAFSTGYDGDISFMVPRDDLRIIRTSGGPNRYEEIND
jgi:hypothetical protein